MHLVQILLPLYDNEGEPIPQLQFRRVSGEMADRFGGVTAFTRAPAEGLWKDAGENTSHDEIVVVEVMVADLDRAWWADYRNELERRFRQEVVVIRAQEIEQL